MPGALDCAAAIWYACFETVSSSALSRERVGASFLWGYGHLFAFAGIAGAAVGWNWPSKRGARRSRAVVGDPADGVRRPAAFLRRSPRC
jgi:hypothetical protein